MQDFHVHYDMEDSYIGYEFKVVYHSLSTTAAVAVNFAGGFHSGTREGAFSPLHFILRIKSMTMSY